MEDLFGVLVFFALFVLLAFAFSRRNKRTAVTCPECDCHFDVITSKRMNIKATCEQCSASFIAFSNAQTQSSAQVGEKDTGMGAERAAGAQNRPALNPIAATAAPTPPISTTQEQASTTPHTPAVVSVSQPPQSVSTRGGSGLPSIIAGGSAIAPNDVIEHRYEVLESLGEGAMGNVYLARHVGLRSLHALKFLKPDLAQHADVRNRFLAEGQIQAQLRHSNIAQVSDIVTDPLPGLVMEYVEGLSLGDFLEAHGAPLDRSSLASIMLPILKAVGTAHTAGIIHRDLKPDNILVGRSDRGQPRPVITDFGIAKVLDGTSIATGKKRTEAGMRLGTIAYMAPEQVRGLPDIDHRVDIFALGAILYELATGTVAFDAPSEFDAMRMIVDGTFHAPESRVEDLDEVVATCIRKALAVDPASRFSSCDQFHQMLGTGLDQQR